jgi:phage gp36-like protein
MAYFSSKASVTARASAYRLLLWTDKDRDDIADTTTLNKGFEGAQTIIREYLNKRYGEAELLAWETSTPETIAKISDDLCLWELCTTNPAASALARQIRDDAIVRLELIRDYTNDVYDATEGYLYDFETDTPQAIFDDELTTRLAVSAAEEED